jgi:hypothetical protein
MKKRLIIAFSILFVFLVIILFLFVEVVLFFDIPLINPVRVKPAELYADYVDAKNLAEEIFTEELKDTEYMVSQIKPIIEVVYDCPRTESGWVSYPHGHQYCKRYYDVANMAKATIKKDGKNIDIYCYLDETKNKHESKIFTDAYFKDIYSGLEKYLLDEINKIYKCKNVEIEYFLSQPSPIQTAYDKLHPYHDRLFPYQDTSFDKLLADQTVKFEVIVRVDLADDVELDEEKSQRLLDLIPYPEVHEMEYRLYINGKWTYTQESEN